MAEREVLLPEKPAYHTDLGAAYCGDSLELLSKLPDGAVDLVITSPPFALQRQKEYGNKDQAEYIDWLTGFARLVHQKLNDHGSFVLDLGGAYRRGVPARSLYNFRAAIRFCDEVGFFLAEDFYWFNPSKLPSPIEWVNKRKMRAKDAVNTVWWFSKTEWPKADVTNVLTEYSDRMKRLLEAPDSFYSPAERPSGHDIGRGFGKRNQGAIPSNLLKLPLVDEDSLSALLEYYSLPPNLLEIPNSESNSQYLRGCKSAGVKAHPARFPPRLPEFFVRFLTDPFDLVVDIFAGSNTTGMVAEKDGRQWLAFDERLDYLAASAFRFFGVEATAEEAKSVYQRIKSGETVNMEQFSAQQDILGQHN